MAGGDVTAEISPNEARRIALTAQGFNASERDRAATPQRLRRTIGELGLLQIDSVNVLARAHYLPLFSRLGSYDRTALDRIMVERPRRFFEYWGHEASLLPIDSQPLFRWRMERARAGDGIWGRLQPYATTLRGEADALLERIAREGPLAASDIAEAVAEKGMWAWSEAKQALEWLFWSGLVAATHRRGSFERVYDLPERVLPRRVLDLPTPAAVDAQRALIGRAAKALGIATAGDLRDYYRLPAPDMAEPLRQLVEDGTLTPVKVRGWKQEAYLHAGAKAGRRLAGAALVSPFDPLVWHRPRTERLFGFRYRLEIYTPRHKREHGYYVLPFLLDGALVARVDLKADRGSGTLVVQQASLEPAAPPHAVEALLAELRRMAAWLDLGDVDAAAVARLGREAG
ncbi:winged helix-turn-helix domain-containing protein [Jiella sonneratiae]|uniref:YcaQ family DNA glycosylase n=1 Tax=Jiella sonneratiae TaxID=2816856 RepID=A0ABS3J7G5_9HYPH|nr:crosslink repair DNA glycosylase YcaQ family protein [Jiella sonneratiae]MBO0905613.1 YcaQ family DNA glycosylase [Jiella sonneratiae]